MFIDTHAHIYLEEFDEDLDSIIKNAEQLGVQHIFMPNIDETSIDAIHKVESDYANCHAMMGLHPCYVKDNYKEVLKAVEEAFDQRNYSAVGEVGIDMYWDKTTYDIQQEAFDRQIQLARDTQLPVIIHSRDSLDLTIESIKRFQNGSLTGIFHCFNGTVEQGKKIIDLGFYLGIGGVVTFKNAGVAETVAQLDLEYMVLETDAPYLTPTPYRGKRNTPEYIPIIAEKLADVQQVSIDRVADITTQNSKKIFASVFNENRGSK